MKLKVGDIFTIPISEGKTGFGQVINIPNKSNFIIVVFRNIYIGEDWPSLREIVNDEILFFGYTMDAKLYHKHWVIIGNEIENLKKIKFPYYKLGTPPDANVVNLKGEVIRKLNEGEFNKLHYKTVFAPVEFELALKAHYKLVAWEDGFDELLYERVHESIEVVEGSKSK